MVAIKSVVCTSCHLEEFQGDSSVPRLAGQEHDYLAKTMTDFRDRARANNPGMSDLMTHRHARAACGDRDLSRRLVTDRFLLRTLCRWEKAR